MAKKGSNLIKALSVTFPILIVAAISLVFAFHTVSNPPQAQKFVPPTQTQKATQTQPTTQH